MKNEVSVELDQGNAGTSQRVTVVREALICLHKALLESERVSYEQLFGKIGSAYEFLQLATTDPWFVWLRPLAQLIIEMDEMLEAKEPLTAAGVEALTSQIKALLIPKSDGQGFSQHYDEALQRDPDVVFAHAAAARLLRVQGDGRKTF